MTDFHTPKSEMFWRPDPAVDAACKLPDWPAFHTACGRSGLCFDHVERDGKRGAYVADALQIVRQGGGYTLKLLATGRAADVVGALRCAYDACGIVAPDAGEMLARGLAGAPRSVVPVPEPVATADPFEELFG